MISAKINYSDMSRTGFQPLPNLGARCVGSTLRVAHHQICDAKHPQTWQGDLDVRGMLTVPSHAGGARVSGQCVAGAD
jgi:hypothetical protein